MVWQATSTLPKPEPPPIPVDHVIHSIAYELTEAPSLLTAASLTLPDIDTNKQH